MKEQARAQRDMLRAQQQAYRYQMRSMRRGSVLGPLLIIVIGIVFLMVQTGHLDSHNLWDWYARWWPILLVGAGVVMLLEWVIDQRLSADQPTYRRRSIGGGVFTLLLLLGLTGIVFSGIRSGSRDFFGRGLNLNQDNIDEFLGDKHESDQSLTQSFPTGAGLTIENPRGDITVSGTSDDNQIHISVHKQVYTRSDSDADTKAQQISPKLTTNDNVVTVALPSIEGAHADLIITAPPSAALNVMTNRGDVHVSSMKAPITVTANHGDVMLSAITGDVKTRINNGDSSLSAHSITGALTIEGRGRDLTLSDLSGPVAMDGEFFGTTHLEHIRGPIRFHTSRTDFRLARLDGEIEISPNADLSADQAVGPLVLTTRNRNITLERVAGDISVTNRNGSVELTSAPPLGNVTVENRNGNVSLTVPEESGFTVQAETTNGDLENDFSLPTQGSDTHKNFGGVVGKGGPLLRITTSQGDIAMKKGSIMPLPPTPPAPPKLTALPPDAKHAIDDAKAAANEASAEARKAAQEAKEEARRAVEETKKETKP
jgi:DUF4097 and DUF4098 domain-containing protein YvlB